MAKKVDNGNRTCKVNGERMTLAERNLRMKLDYVNGSLTLKALAHKYDLGESTVAAMSKEGKWSQQRKKFLEECERAINEECVQVYAKCGADITVQHNNTWQKLMNIVNDILNNPHKYLMTADGKYKIGALELIANILTQAQQGQNLSTGFISKVQSLQLELNKQSLELRRKQLGDDDDVVVEDNFMEALTNVADMVWNNDNPEV